MATFTAAVEGFTGPGWRHRWVRSAAIVALAAGVLAAPRGLVAQGASSSSGAAATGATQAGTTQAGTTPTQAAPAVRTVRPRRRRSRPAAPATGQETPQTTADRVALQKAADARLLAQQQAASQAVKKVNDAQVQAYDASRQKMQNEPRIVDAPTLNPPVRATVTPDPDGIHDNPNPVPPTPGQTGAVPVETPAEEAAPPKG